MNDDLERQLRELSERTGSGQTGLPQFDRVARKRVRVRQTISAIAASAVLFGAVAGGLGIANGFGSQSTPARTVSANVIAAATTATESAGSARVSLAGKMAMHGDSFENTTLFEGSGEFDFAKARGHMTVGGLGNTDQETIFDGNAMYTNGTDEYEGKWIKFEITPSKSFGLSGSSGMEDPTAMLASLRDVADVVEVVGKDEIRGVTTTHYRAEIDPEKAFSSAGEEFPDELGIESIPVEIWVDDQDLVRRFLFDFDVSIDRMGQHWEMSMAVSVEFFDFGVPVTIELPPAEDVISSEEYMEERGLSGYEDESSDSSEIHESIKSKSRSYTFRSKAQRVKLRRDR